MLSFQFVEVPQVYAGSQALEPATTVEQFQVDPVPARIDRVWKAIPGLNGWALDERASEAATQKAGDGKRHLVWTAIPPSPGLADLQDEPIYRGPDADHSVALMVNVSWGEQYLPSMLNTLRSERVKATFFLDGDWARKNPALAKAIVSSGQCIGSHGTGHPDFRHLSIGQIDNQMRKSDTIIHSVTGVHPVAFAPPAGAFDHRTVTIADRHGLRTILWTVDTIDWRKPPADVIVRRVTTKANAGCLVLMHPTAPTATALPVVIRELKSRGYNFKTIAEVVGEERQAPPAVMPGRS